MVKTHAALLLVAAMGFGCARTVRTIEAPPPSHAPQELVLEAEHVHRGHAPEQSASDTERQEGRIRMAILRRRTEIQDCYERVLPASPDAAGRIEFAFTVETSGIITDPTGETPVAALHPTRDCILAFIRNTRVQDVTAAARVHLPFVFENPPLEFVVPEFVLTPRMRVSPPGTVAAAIQAGSGNLSTDEARAVVETRLPDFLACYTTHLRTARRAEGISRFDLTLGPDGTVAEVATAEATESVAPVAACQAALLRGLNFRNTARRATVTVLFSMHPREPAPEDPAHPRANVPLMPAPH